MIYNILYIFKLLSFIRILSEAKYFGQKLSTLVKKKKQSVSILHCLFFDFDNGDGMPLGLARRQAERSYWESSYRARCKPKQSKPKHCLEFRPLETL